MIVIFQEDEENEDGNSKDEEKPGEEKKEEDAVQAPAEVTAKTEHEGENVQQVDQAQDAATGENQQEEVRDKRP